MFDSKWKYLSIKEPDETILSKILSIRGLNEDKTFFESDLKFLHDPFLMNDMMVAADRIKSAVENNEKICIYGDYDADGITSAAIILKFLYTVNANAEYFIPGRFEDGYGLSMKTSVMLKEKRFKLIITTDCGILSTEEVNYLNTNDIDVIITDHHEAGEELPKALAVLCCTRKDNKYPYPFLSGAGVAFKLVQALCKTYNLGSQFEEYLDIAALGTVADIVPLTGENRIIVKSGIELIRYKRKTGITAIIENAGVKQNSVTACTLGFVVGPHINAAGRNGEADKAMELIMETNYNKAVEKASYLTILNKKRKKEQQSVYEKVKNIILKDKNILDFPVLIIAEENLNRGVIGIVASKLCGELRKPVILLEIENNIAKGSGRSIEKFSLIKALGYCKNLLIQYGGHDKAAGIEIENIKITEFREKLTEYYNKFNKNDSFDNEKFIDLLIEPYDMNFDNFYELEKLEPCGEGNRKPIVALCNIELVGLRKVGKNKKHLHLTFSVGGKYIKGICFNGNIYESFISENEFYDVAFYPEINSYNGKSQIQMKINDMEFYNQDDDTNKIMLSILLIELIESGRTPLHDSIKEKLKDHLFKLGMHYTASGYDKSTFDFHISRDEITKIYRIIKAYRAGYIFDIRKIDGIPGYKMYLVVEILLELGIFSLRKEGIFRYIVDIHDKGRKNSLKNSGIYNTICASGGEIE